jgi:hypothetical protein
MCVYFMSDFFVLSLQYLSVVSLFCSVFAAFICMFCIFMTYSTSCWIHGLYVSVCVCERERTQTFWDIHRQLQATKIYNHEIQLLLYLLFNLCILFIAVGVHYFLTCSALN